MAEPLAITILRKKRDRIRDTIAKYEARLKEAQADLAHVIAAWWTAPRGERASVYGG